MEHLTQALLLPVWLPIAAGFLCLLLPRAWRAAHVGIGLAASAVVLVLAWRLFAGSPSAVAPWPWLALRVDALSAFVALSVGGFGVLVSIYSVGYLRGRGCHREYYAYLLITLGAAFGVALANDLLVLLVFWGVLAVTLYLMAGLAGPQAASAARKTFMIVGGSDAALLFGVVLVWTLAGSTRMDAGPIALEGASAHVAFLAFAVAAFAKAGAVPLHSWVPDFGEKADAPVSAFLPAALDKLLGIYLLARCALDLFVLTEAMGSVLMMFGAVTVVAAVMMALFQHDLKRLLAFHAVSQVGYMLLGIGTGTAVGIAGGLFHMLNHAIYKCCLFLCAGSVEKATGTTDLDRLGGLARLMPVTFGVCTVAALAIAGVPPLSGFASKWMVYQGLVERAGSSGGLSLVWLAAAMLGSALTLASFVKVLHATFLCAPSPETSARVIRESPVIMTAPAVVLAALCVVFGVFASAVPLGWLILPAVPADVAGVWWSGTATVLILTAILAGAALYAVTMAAGKLRRTDPYVGGEHLDETYLAGIPPGPARHVTVTGVDFYRTIEELPVVDRLYALARRRAFDLYFIGAGSAAYVVGTLRRLHGGVLPFYLAWFLAGLIAVLYVTGGGVG